MSTARPKQVGGIWSSSQYIPSLDGIRACCITLVFVAHAGLGDILPGGFGVTVFFFLSGYLITTLLRVEAERTGRISLRDFYIRRVLRIFPPFYVTLLLLVLVNLAGVLKNQMEWKAVFFQGMHLANYWALFGDPVHNPAGSDVLWSLAVEEHFYLVFPLLYIVLRRLFSVRNQCLILWAMCAAILAWRCVLIWHFQSGMAHTYYATDTRADSILFGCILAIGCNPVLDPVTRSKRLNFWALMGVLLILFSVTYRNPAFRETFRYSLQGLALFPIFLASIVNHQDGPFAWLNLKVVRWVGVLSYTLYLVHFGVMMGVQQHLPAHPVVQGVVAAALCLGLAVAYYFLLERPCARLRKRFAHAGGGRHRTTDESPYSVGAAAPALAVSYEPGPPGDGR